MALIPELDLHVVSYSGISQIKILVDRGGEGGESGTPVPLGPIPFILMQFSTKILPNNDRLLSPPLVLASLPV